VFVRGFRAKHVSSGFVFATGSLCNDLDGSRENEVQVTTVPDVLSHRDPLTGVLDYIAEHCPDDTIAIAHDDDLSLVEGVVRPMSNAQCHIISPVTKSNVYP